MLSEEWQKNSTAKALIINKNNNNNNNNNNNISNNNNNSFNIKANPLHMIFSHILCLIFAVTFNPLDAKLFFAKLL